MSDRANAALTRQEVDLESGDLGDCADENNETFAKRHSEREREKGQRWHGGGGQGCDLSGGNH